MLPSDGRWVSCRAAMSMFSLVSSLSMIAVFLASSLFCKSVQQVCRLQPIFQLLAKVNGLWRLRTRTLLAGVCPAEAGGSQPVEFPLSAVPRLLDLAAVRQHWSGSPECSPGRDLGLADVVQRRAKQKIWHRFGYRDCCAEIICIPPPEGITSLNFCLCLLS